MRMTGLQSRAMDVVLLTADMNQKRKGKTMSDYISREAAIEAIREITLNAGGMKMLFKNEMAVDRIKQLPAADVHENTMTDAEIRTILDVSRQTFEQFKWERDTAVQQLEELGYGLGEKVNKYDSKLWIPCDKELPKNDDWKIVTIYDDSGDNPYIYTDFGWYLEAGGYWIVHDEPRRDVVAWMVLPNPYKERKYNEKDV